jgi:flagellin-specific chaperone FliS
MMVVDGAIRHAVRAEQALRSHDIEKAHFALADSRKFVTELISRIDPAPLPDVAANLKALFLFVHRNLVEADRRRAPELIADAITILRLHRETWTALGEKLKQESVPAPHSKTSETKSFSWTT